MVCIATGDRSNERERSTRLRWSRMVCLAKGTVVTSDDCQVNFLLLYSFVLFVLFEFFVVISLFIRVHSWLHTFSYHGPVPLNSRRSGTVKRRWASPTPFSVSSGLKSNSASSVPKNVPAATAVFKSNSDFAVPRG